METHFLELYDTLTRQKKQFVPQALEVTLYTCGPTVYNFVHIGNLRTFLFEDVLRRTLKYLGYEVLQVMNITDVGHMTIEDVGAGQDKMQVAALREKKEPLEIARFYTEAFLRDVGMLNILPANIYPRATDHIPEMLSMIRTLIDKGHAYQTKKGVYFDINSLPSYGKLSGKKLEENKNLSRGELIEDEEKKHPADFALWKIADKNHLMQWDSEWGRGFPGWHIECSAMSKKYLGETIDIHCGGEDHIPVHHENEIAQSEGSTGTTFVNYWLHGAFLQVDGGRMGKSLGNFYTLQDVVDQGYSPMAYRYFVLQAHYRSKLNFTWEALQNAAAGLRNLYREAANAQMAGVGQEADTAQLESAKERFTAAVADDLNMPQAMAVVWEVLRAKDVSPATKTAFLVDADEVLGLDIAHEREKMCQVTPEISELVREREEARTRKDYATSDALRKKLNELGVDILDTPDGPRCQIIG
jgi:cysteinyl-tRNA synthetase